MVSGAVVGGAGVVLVIAGVLVLLGLGVRSVAGRVTLCKKSFVSAGLTGVTAVNNGLGIANAGCCGAASGGGAGNSVCSVGGNAFGFELVVALARSSWARGRIKSIGTNAVLAVLSRRFGMIKADITQAQINNSTKEQGAATSHRLTSAGKEEVAVRLCTLFLRACCHGNAGCTGEFGLVKYADKHAGLGGFIRLNDDGTFRCVRQQTLDIAAHGPYINLMPVDPDLIVTGDRNQYRFLG
jgi:hypothetical protein